MSQGDLAHRRSSDDASGLTRMQRAPRPGDAESTWSLVSGAITDVAELASTELQLAKLGLDDAKREVVRRAPALAVGGVMLLIAAVFGIVGLSRALELVVPAWAAALLAGLAAAMLGGVGLWIGLRRGPTVPALASANPTNEVSDRAVRASGQPTT